MDKKIKRQRDESIEDKPPPKWLCRLNRLTPSENYRISSNQTIEIPQTGDPSESNGEEDAPSSPSSQAEDIHVLTQDDCHSHLPLVKQLQFVSTAPLSFAMLQQQIDNFELAAFCFPPPEHADLLPTVAVAQMLIDIWRAAFGSLRLQCARGVVDSFWCTSKSSILSLFHLDENPSQLALRFGPAKKSFREGLYKLGIPYQIWSDSGETFPDPLFSSLSSSLSSSSSSLSSSSSSLSSSSSSSSSLSSSSSSSSISVSLSTFSPSLHRILPDQSALAPVHLEDLKALESIPGQLVSLYSTQHLSYKKAVAAALSTSSIIYIQGASEVSRFLDFYLQDLLDSLSQQLTLLAAQQIQHFSQCLPLLLSYKPFLYSQATSFKLDSSTFLRPTVAMQRVEQASILTLKSVHPSLPIIPFHHRRINELLLEENNHVTIEAKTINYRN